MLELVTHGPLGDPRRARTIGRREPAAIVDRARHEPRSRVRAGDLDGVERHAVPERAEARGSAAIALDRGDHRVRGLVAPASRRDRGGHGGVARERGAQAVTADEPGPIDIRRDAIREEGRELPALK